LEARQGQGNPFNVLMCSSSMELLTLIDLKTSQPPAIEKKEKKDQKKDPLPPKVADFLLY